MTLADRTKNLKTFVQEELPDVASMRRQLSDEECEKLFDFASSKEIKDVLLNMENTVGIEKKYKSVYLTARNWIKKQRQFTKSTMTKGKNPVGSGLFTYSEAMAYCDRKSLSLDLKQHFDMVPQEDDKKPLWRLKTG